MRLTIFTNRGVSIGRVPWFCLVLPLGCRQRMNWQPLGIWSCLAFGFLATWLFLCVSFFRLSVPEEDLEIKELMARRQAVEDSLANAPNLSNRLM